MICFPFGDQKGRYRAFSLLPPPLPPPPATVSKSPLRKRRERAEARQGLELAGWALRPGPGPHAPPEPRDTQPPSGQRESGKPLPQGGRPSGCLVSCWGVG